MQTKPLSLRITADESRALRERARKDGVSRATLVRRALRAYGVTPERDASRSGYDLIKDIVGRNRGGAKDLSTNPKHLADYGR